MTHKDTHGGACICHSCTPAPLSAFERWMVRSNLATITAGEETAAATVATLRANGYARVAAAVEAAAR